jgi:hypothetical protein
MSTLTSVARRMLLPLAALIALIALVAPGVSQFGTPTIEPAAATTSVAASEKDKTVTAREVWDEMFEARAAGASPKELSKFFDKDVDWFIQGDTDSVPWLGRKVGRAEIVEHFTQLEELTRPEKFQVDAVIGDGDRAVALGTFRVNILATGLSFDSEFAFDITVDDNGLITRYHVLEDSFALSNAYTPGQ